MTKAVALNLHLPLTEKEGKRISEKISKSAPLLMAVSQAAVAEFEKQNLHYRTLKKKNKTPVYNSVLHPHTRIAFSCSKPIPYLYKNLEKGVMFSLIDDTSR